MTQNNFESHAENFVRNSNAAQHQETAVCLSSTAIFSHKTQQKMTLDFSESIPVCVAFAIGGGLLEVRRYINVRNEGFFVVGILLMCTYFSSYCFQPNSQVFATAVLAYPAARILEGHHWSDWALKGCLALNIVLQIVASLSGNLFATWFGPVSVVAPVFFAAQLLANLVVYWIALGLEAFSHEMQSGCIAGGCCWN